MALRHSPSTLGLGGYRRLLGESCATSSLDRDRAGGQGAPAPDRAQAAPGRGDFGGLGGFCTITLLPVPFSQYSPS